MPEKYITLRGNDAVEFEEFRDRLDEEIAGGIDSNAQTVRAALDLAADHLDTRR